MPIPTRANEGEDSAAERVVLLRCGYYHSVALTDAGRVCVSLAYSSRRAPVHARGLGFRFTF